MSKPPRTPAEAVKFDKEPLHRSTVVLIFPVASTISVVTRVEVANATEAVEVAKVGEVAEAIEVTEVS